MWRQHWQKGRNAQPPSMNSYDSSPPNNNTSAMTGVRTVEKPSLRCSGGWQETCASFPPFSFSFYEMYQTHLQTRYKAMWVATPHWRSSQSSPSTADWVNHQSHFQATIARWASAEMLKTAFNCLVSPLSFSSNTPSVMTWNPNEKHNHFVLWLRSILVA